MAKRKKKAAPMKLPAAATPPKRSGGPVSDKEWAAFIGGLRASGRIIAAAQAAGIGTQTVYDRRGSDPEFHQLVSKIRAAHLQADLDLLRDLQMDRAIRGVEKPSQWGTYREFPPARENFILSRLLRAEFGDAPSSEGGDDRQQQIQDFVNLVKNMKPKEEK